jgi:4a-hydroxytetrahydrobiopterin dehydratase
MSQLAEQNFISAKDQIEQLDPQAVETLLEKLPGWKVVSVEGVNRLERTYDFDDFEDALDFVNEVGEIAEEVNHHPVIEFTWGTATVTWWTHFIDGLHKNDFIMAARTDQVFQD